MRTGTLSQNQIETMAPRASNVVVRVTVDETGKIVEAVADTKDGELGEKAVREVSKWTVRPFAYNGSARKIRGHLSYTEPR